MTLDGKLLDADILVKVSIAILSFGYEVQLSMVNFPHLLCCDSSDQIILDIFSIKTL